MPEDKLGTDMNVGGKYTYTHETGLGFGEAALGSPLSAEMKELDLVDGQEVELLALDADSAWPIIQWTDGVGINRITTIDPEVFESQFQAAGEES